MSESDEILNLKRSLDAQVEINKSLVAENQRLKDETPEQKMAKSKKEESDLKSSEAPHKTRDGFN